MAKSQIIEVGKYALPIQIMGVCGGEGAGGFGGKGREWIFSNNSLI